MVQEQSGRPLQSLRELDDFLLWNLADHSPGFPVQNLDDNPIKVWIN